MTSKSRPLTHTDIAQEEMGNNSLQGNDQANIRNERRAVPGVKLDADDVREAFRKADKDVRAESDLGKGNRQGNTVAELRGNTVGRWDYSKAKAGPLYGR